MTGTADGTGGGGALYTDSAMIYGAVAAPNAYVVRMTDAVAPGDDGVLTITAKADLDGADEFLTISAEGVVLGDVFINGGANFTAVSTQVTLPAAHLAAMTADVMAGLYDAGGVLVARGRQLPNGRVMLKYKAPRRAVGEYFIQVTADADTRIDDVLSVA